MKKHTRNETMREARPEVMSAIRGLDALLSDPLPHPVRVRIRIAIDEIDRIRVRIGGLS